MRNTLTRAPSPAASPATASARTPTLRRTLGLFLLVLYGLGTTIGAGIYVLVGKVAGMAGPYGHYAFLLALAAVLLPALAYAEFVGRAPYAAGSARYVAAGFRSPALGTLVGLAIAIAGLISSAALSLGAAGYLARWLPLPEPVTAVALVSALALIAVVGIRQSVLAAGVITMLEVGGLLLIILVGLAHGPGRVVAVLVHPPPMTMTDAARVFGASLLTFFAFIGFEDMVTMAEETKRPERTIAHGILITLFTTAIVYLLVYAVATATIPHAELARSREPLALVAARLPLVPADMIAAIAAVAVINGILIQIIMASRIFYGLARTSRRPAALRLPPVLRLSAVLGWVHPRFRTPVNAVILAWLTVVALVLAFPEVAGLAGMTSRLVLAVYALVCAALLAVKWRGEPPPAGAFRAPAPLVAAGFVICVFLLFVA